MTINNIRYWDSSELKTDLKPLSTSLASDDDKSGSFSENIPESFDVSLLDIFSQSGSHSQSLYSNSFFGYDLNSTEQLRKARIKAKDMGMEKVLSAQLASPLPTYGRNSNDQHKSYDSLNTIANLTIQLQMAKVSKVMDHLRQTKTISLDEYISSIKDN